MSHSLARLQRNQQVLTELETDSDMTRVIVTAVDSFGQVVPQTSDLATLSAGGAGAVACMACCRELTEAKALIAVCANPRKAGQCANPAEGPRYIRALHGSMWGGNDFIITGKSEGTVFMQNAENITIKNCLFDQIGGNGVFMSVYNRYNVVYNN